MNETYVRALTRALTRVNQQAKRDGSLEAAHTLARHLVAAVDADPTPGTTTAAQLEALGIVARVTDLPDDLARRLRRHPDPDVRTVGWRYAHASTTVEEWNASILEESRSTEETRKAVYAVMVAHCPWDELSDEAVRHLLGMKTDRLTVTAARAVIAAGWRPAAARMWRRALLVLNAAKTGETMRKDIVAVLTAGHLPDVVDEPQVSELYRLAAACAYTAPSGRVTELLTEWGQRLDDTGTTPDFGPRPIYDLRDLQSSLMTAPHGRAADLNELRNWITRRLKAGETPAVVTMIADLRTGRPEEVFTRQVDEATTKTLDGLRLAWARLPQEARTHDVCRHVLSRLPNARHLCRDVLAHLGEDAIAVTASMPRLDDIHLQNSLPQWLSDLDVNLWVHTFRAIERSGPSPTSALWDASEAAIDAAVDDLLADATQWQPLPAAALALRRDFGPKEWERMTMGQLTQVVESGTEGDPTADWLAGIFADSRFSEGASAMSMALLSDTDTRLCDVLVSVDALT